MKYKSEIFEVLHENAVEMYKVGGITEASMREYDEMCLVTPKSNKKSASVHKEEKPITKKHRTPVSA